MVEAQSTAWLQTLGIFMGFAHCWRPYSDFEMQNSDEGTVPLFKFVSKHNVE